MAATTNWSQTALLVVDMQNDFILPGAPFHVAGGEAIVESVARAVSVARDRGIFVVWACAKVISCRDEKADVNQMMYFIG